MVPTMRVTFWQRLRFLRSLVAELAQRLRSLQAGVDAAEKNVAAAERRLEAEKNALREEETKLDESAIAVAQRYLKKRLKSELESPETAKKLRAVGSLVGQEDLASDVNTLASTVKEAATVSGKLALIGRVLLGGGIASRLSLLAILVAGVAALAWAYIDVQTWEASLLKLYPPSLFSAQPLLLAGKQSP